MTDHNIDSILLYELRGLPRSPTWLRGALSRWDHDVSTTKIVERLTELRDQGLVDGPGISLLHHQWVDLTARGRSRGEALAAIGGDVGGWRRVG